MEGEEWPFDEWKIPEDSVFYKSLKAWISLELSPSQWQIHSFLTAANSG